MCLADADWEVFDMGFPGDKVQNVMWRVLQGTLAGYDPARIVISVGSHNKGANTEAEIAVPDGIQSLYFTFAGQGHLQFAGFELKK